MATYHFCTTFCTTFLYHFLYHSLSVPLTKGTADRLGGRGRPSPGESKSAEKKPENVSPGLDSFYIKI